MRRSYRIDIDYRPDGAIEYHFMRPDTRKRDRLGKRDKWVSDGEGLIFVPGTPPTQFELSKSSFGPVGSLAAAIAYDLHCLRLYEQRYASKQSR
jgi:hypothetical protein